MSTTRSIYPTMIFNMSSNRARALSFCRFRNQTWTPFGGIPGTFGKWRCKWYTSRQLWWRARHWNPARISRWDPTPRMAPSTLDFKLVIFWLKSVFSHPSTAQTYVIRFTQTTAYFCKQNISSSYCLCFSELWLLHAKSEGDVRQCQASNYPNLGIGMEVFNCPKKKDCFWMFVIMISRVIPFE